MWPTVSRSASQRTASVSGGATVRARTRLVSEYASWPVSGIRSTPSVHSGSFVLSLPLIQRYCMRGSMLCSRPSMFQGPPPVE